MTADEKARALCDTEPGSKHTPHSYGYCNSRTDMPTARIGCVDHCPRCRAIAAALKEADERATERACKAVCGMCRDGWEMLPTPAEYKGWDRVHKSPRGIPVMCTREANRIRAAAEEVSRGK